MHFVSCGRPRLHHHRHPHPGPGHRRQRGHLYPGQRRPAAQPPRRRSKDPRPHRRHQRLLRQLRFTRRATTRFSPPKPISCSKRTCRSLKNWRPWNPASPTGPSPRAAKTRRAVAKSVMGEFVSGNYFRTFGLQPAAGRFFTDADDTKGAALHRRDELRRLGSTNTPAIPPSSAALSGSIPSPSPSSASRPRATSAIA